MAIGLPCLPSSLNIQTVQHLKGSSDSGPDLEAWTPGLWVDYLDISLPFAHHGLLERRVPFDMHLKRCMQGRSTSKKEALLPYMFVGTVGAYSRTVAPNRSEVGVFQHWHS